MLGNNRTFYWQVELIIRIISDDRPKERMKTINGKWGDNYFVINSIGKTIFSR